jgi:hypothetical protein
VVSNTITLSGKITKDTTLFAKDVNYLSGLVYVTKGVTVTVEAGAKVQGRSGSNVAALIITRGAKLVAKGTESSPIVFTSSSPFYSSFLQKNIAHPAGLHFSSDAFLQFLPSGEDSLLPEAAGLQTFVPTRPPSVDTAFTSGQDLILSQLKAVHGFDSSLLSSFIFPADGSLASVIISLRDIFNKFV